MITAAPIETTTTGQAAPDLADPRGIRLVRATRSLWRVVSPAGRVLGHLQAIPHPQGERYRARRYHPASATFVDLGDFWSADDAVACLR